LTKPAEYKVAFTLKDPDSDVPSIAVLDAGFGWPGAKPLFQGLRFSVDTGSRVAIVGPNGSGKVAIQKKRRHIRPPSLLPTPLRFVKPLLPPLPYRVQSLFSLLKK
jgi:hypothetical protein